MLYFFHVPWTCFFVVSTQPTLKAPLVNILQRSQKHGIALFLFLRLLLFYRHFFFFPVYFLWFCSSVIPLSGETPSSFSPRSAFQRCHIVSHMHIDRSRRRIAYKSCHHHRTISSKKKTKRGTQNTHMIHKPNIYHTFVHDNQVTYIT